MHAEARPGAAQQAAALGDRLPDGVIWPPRPHIGRSLSVRGPPAGHAGAPTDGAARPAGTPSRKTRKTSPLNSPVTGG